MTVSLADVTLGMSVGKGCFVSDVEILFDGRRTVTVSDDFGTVSTYTGSPTAKLSVN